MGFIFIHKKLYQIVFALLYLVHELNNYTGKVLDHKDRVLYENYLKYYMLFTI